MGDILSQSEIDELLEALATEKSVEEPDFPDVKKEIREYDFARPPKFNKDHLRTLEIIFDNYARNLSTFLTGYLRTTVELSIVGSEQISYGEFTNTLLNPIILSIFEMEPLKGVVISELSASVGYAVIDRVLGGAGDTLEKLREFSDIEKILIKRFQEHLLNFLVEPWENVVSVNPVLDKIETNSQFSQIIPPNEIVALVTLKMKIGNTEGVLSYCMPHRVLETVIEKLNTKNWHKKSSEEIENDYKERIADNLEKADIRLSATIGKTSITLDEFVSLQVGDVIQLDSYLETDINVKVGEILKFKAKPGISKNKNAIQITKLIGREEL